jgi:hypothetical protein
MRLLLASAALAATVAMSFPVTAATAAVPTKAPFGCDARAGQTCYFLIFYQGGRGRVIILPAGMKESIPEVVVGRDSYCVGLSRTPSYKCTRKVINATYNN